MNIEQFTQRMKEKFSNENYSIIYAGKNSYENSKILISVIILVIIFL